ncbi:MAG: UDP-N-acetylglucosamine 1-carboxyvinyltransferase [bacterium]|nr:UDP-N-acetylglucosamine 1-carboxyvinyltransferase [bacterium]MDZ4299297.1 UDP-N-acetylglucosamine 1-carboxyvinyltransferase [Candidatus Sungbacteria bacterium]
MAIVKLLFVARGYRFYRSGVCGNKTTRIGTRRFFSRIIAEDALFEQWYFFLFSRQYSMSEGRFIIRGGRQLEGETVVYGSKNAATKMMVASLLTREPCVLENIPLSGETDITRELCERIGSRMSGAEGSRWEISTPEIATSVVPELSRKNRIPILALGPLLHRKGFAEVPVLGGCPIGHRPINFHLEALNRMGVRIERRAHSYYAEAEEIHGADLVFPFPSVGATESVLLTGVLAKGTTTIHNAATEPEIMNLIGMLRAMGADIRADEVRREIEIYGVERLGGVSARVMPDRNEVVSFATAALATDGDIFIRDASANGMQAFFEAVCALGGTCEVREDGVRFFGRRPYRRMTIQTAPHPGFMTDWQQPFCVLLTQAEGASIIHETVYDDRFGYVKDLCHMGANITVTDECLGGERCRFDGATYNHSARITGPTKLSGAAITVPDLRAGMAHMIAALAAEGESVISGIGHIDRGYAKLDERLRALGADIMRK